VSDGLRIPPFKVAREAATLLVLAVALQGAPIRGARATLVRRLLRERAGVLGQLHLGVRNPRARLRSVLACTLEGRIASDQILSYCGGLLEIIDRLSPCSSNPFRSG
jgi:hypothetical protein